MANPPDPPTPFRDHERWIEHQQHLYGGAAWLVCGLLVAAIGFWLQAETLAVETVEGGSGATGFHVEFVGPFFQYAFVTAIGVAIASTGWRYLADARTLRKIAAQRNMVESVVAITLMGTILNTIIEAAEEVDPDA